MQKLVYCARIKTMRKKTSLHDNYDVNFILKGFTSILAGIYMIVGVYLMQSILSGFLIENNPLGMLSAEIIELLFVGILFFVVMGASLALIFGGRRDAKKFQYKLWNRKTKKIAFQYLLLVAMVFFTLIILMNVGQIDALTPTFLLLYALFLFRLKNKNRAQLLLLSGLALLLAICCFFIPSYWASTLYVLGIGHIAYGVIIR